MEEADPLSFADPELLRQRDELLVSKGNNSYSSPSDLIRYFRRQPPTSADAVHAGDLAYEIKRSIAGNMPRDHPDLEDYECFCSQYHAGFSVWYKLAILLDPNDPVPYKRLAEKIWREDGHWPGTVLAPLARNPDEETVRRVIAEYQQGEAELLEFLQPAIDRLSKIRAPDA